MTDVCLEKVQDHIEAHLSPIASTLWDDCETMACHASRNGLSIPAWVGNALAKKGARVETIRAALDEGAGEEVIPEISKAVREDMRSLVRIHALLSELIAPATPLSLRATARAVTFWGAVRSVPLMGFMFACGLLCLAGFLFLQTGEGASLYLTQLQLLCAAGLGAAFYGLFTANTYVVERTYDPRYTVYYWTRFGLGLIAGVILANLVTPGIEASALKPLVPTTVALLGGYSSDAVNRILKRLVEMLVTLVRGDQKEILEAREIQMRAHLEAREKIERLNTAALLIDACARLESGKSDEAKEILHRLREDLLNNFGDSH